MAKAALPDGPQIQSGVKPLSNSQLTHSQLFPLEHKPPDLEQVLQVDERQARPNAVRTQGSQISKRQPRSDRPRRKKPRSVKPNGASSCATIATLRYTFSTSLRKRSLSRSSSSQSPCASAYAISSAHYMSFIDSPLYEMFRDFNCGFFVRKASALNSRPFRSIRAASRLIS